MKCSQVKFHVAITIPGKCLNTIQNTDVEKLVFDNKLNCIHLVTKAYELFIPVSNVVWMKPE